MKTSKFLLLFTLFISFSVSSFENSILKIKGPKGWTENPKMFGSSVIFESPISSKTAPITLYVKSFAANLGTRDVHHFITKDLKSEFVSNNFTVIKKDLFKRKKMPIYYIEGSLTEQGTLQKIFVAIAKGKSHYHYYMFQAAKSRYDEEIKKIKLSVKTTHFKSFH